MKALIHVLITINICCLIGVIELFIPENRLDVYRIMIAVLFISVAADRWSDLVINKIKKSKKE
ncbi:hypothetical protein [Tenacibaculum sp. 190524A05c]|uniref:hypothetical protein n=1 Tax=Tenacibaculum platacis TaxID=3137852 RepID=UPI0031FA76B1